MSEQKKKAVEILIESLKLYFTFSTVLIAASITYVSKLDRPVSPWLLYSELVAFLLCAIMAIFNVNYFIKALNADGATYDVSVKLSKVPNIIAIFSFFIGIILGGIFFFKNNTNIQNTQGANNDIIIEKGKVIIPSESKAKIKVVVDSIDRKLSIYINEVN